MNSMVRGIGMTSQRTRDRLVARLRSEGVRSEAVLEVIRNTPRHLFVDEALSSRAYEDTALPIGYSQTISQPYIVAAMTELVIAGSPKKVMHDHLFRQRFPEPFVPDDGTLLPLLSIVAVINSYALYLKVVTLPRISALIGHDVDLFESVFGTQVCDQGHVAVVLNALARRTMPFAVGK